MQTDASPPATLLFVPPAAALKGRGTAWALEHRFSERQLTSFDDGWGTLQQAAMEEELQGQQGPATQVHDEAVRSILSRNDSPDIGFDLSINPYRGCEHGCIFRAASQSSRFHQLQG